MTQSHIQFAPLIVPRKTPAEEIREAMSLVDLPDPRPVVAYRLLEQIAARLEATDEPKRWDGVFPWVRASLGDDNVPIVYFDKNLCLSGATGGVVASPLSIVSDDRPYHDGVIITITAGSGDEEVRVVRWNDADKGGINKSLYLRLYRDCGVKLTDCGGRACVGDVVESLHDDQMVPLPPGTVTRITINNTLPTTEQRYSVEVVPAPESKDWLPLYVGNGIELSRKKECLWLNWVGEKEDGCYVAYPDDIDGKPGRKLLEALEKYIGEQDVAANHLDSPQATETCERVLDLLESEGRDTGVGGPLSDLRDDVAANHLDPQEQPATEAVSEGLQLEFRCSLNNSDSFEVWHDTPAGRLVLDHRDYSVHLSPADEARLRNLLNQRHADGKGGGV